MALDSLRATLELPPRQSSQTLEADGTSPRAGRRRSRTSRSPSARTTTLASAKEAEIGPDGRAAHGALAPGAARLIVGERPEHGALERGLASWLGAPAALLFTSGYAANVGAIVSALAERQDDVIVSDELNHAPIIDGCIASRGRGSRSLSASTSLRSSRALRRAEKRARVGRDRVLLQHGRRYAGPRRAAPDLPAAWRGPPRRRGTRARRLSGRAARGCAQQGGLPGRTWWGPWERRLGAGGAFVAGSEALVAWLWNRARSFVFSTGTSPLTAAASLHALRIIAEDEARRARLHENAARLRGGLVRLGLSPGGYGPIVPLVSWRRASRRRRCRGAQGREGAHVQAVRPPTVRPGTARPSHDDGDSFPRRDQIAHSEPSNGRCHGRPCRPDRDGNVRRKDAWQSGCFGPRGTRAHRFRLQARREWVHVRRDVGHRQAYAGVDVSRETVAAIVDVLRADLPASRGSDGGGNDPS